MRHAPSQVSIRALGLPDSQFRTPGIGSVVWVPPASFRALGLPISQSRTLVGLVGSFPCPCSPPCHTVYGKVVNSCSTRLARFGFTPWVFQIARLLLLDLVFVVWGPPASIRALGLPISQSCRLGGGLTPPFFLRASKFCGAPLPGPFPLLPLKYVLKGSRGFARHAPSLVSIHALGLPDRPFRIPGFGFVVGTPLSSFHASGLPTSLVTSFGRFRLFGY